MFPVRRRRGEAFPMRESWESPHDDPDPDGDDDLSSDLDRPAEGGRRESRHKRRRKVGRGSDRERQERRRRKRKSLTPEERALAEARRAAARKMGFLAHFVPYVCVVVFLLFVAGFRPAFITALAWGIALACHYFFAIVAPGLRERLVDNEVSRRVTHGVTRERRALVDEHTHRLEQLSASIAHEIRNPITAAKSLVQQMGEDPASSENVEYASVALDELGRVERSISHLLKYAREEDMDVRELRMDDLVVSALDTFTDRITRLGVTVTRDFGTNGSLSGDPDKLRRVVINLVGNALDAFEENATAHAELDLEAGENLAGSEVWLRVRDNGPGMDEERLGRIFTPFYTSKSSGTGLGLAISKKLVDAHGGSIEAHSEPGRGTEFVVTLPKDAGGEG
jgi:signal transduction histidine kinase